MRPSRSLHTYPSPLGPLLAVFSHEALAGLYFADQADLPNVASLPPAADSDTLRRLGARLQAYFDGQAVHFDLPLAMHGTPFQQTVWTELQACPHGVTLTYGELARRVGRPKGMRAVGQAVGRNPWIIVVPCHRVLAAGGGLGGFSSGLPRKRALLTLEGVQWREPG